jgi:glycosyltransferase involved in cell wall biosynthesis
MDILFVANWSAPGIVGANYASSGIHFELSKRDLNIGVLSSLVGHQHTDENAKSYVIQGQAITELNTNAITYLLPSLPMGWSARHIHNSDWDKAVSWGRALLRHYNPKVVHIQQWQNFWWMAEAASECSIPFIYTPYDFGLICARTVLIRSDGSRCDGVVSDKECEACIFNGRGGIGKINESLVKIRLFSRLLKLLSSKVPQLMLHERGIVLDPIRTRLENDRNRLQKFLVNLDTLVVNSNFSEDLFRTRAPIANVTKIYWFQNLNVTKQSVKNISRLSTVGFIGRISPEKGLEILLESLRVLKDRDGLDVKLIVAGDATSDYAVQLKQKYNVLDIDWLGWINGDSLSEVYDQLDMLVVPSISYDNGPITIMEAIATKTPVIVSNNETLLTYLSEIKSEHAFESGSADALAKLISKYARNPHLINTYISEMPDPMTVEKYVDLLMPTYGSKIISEAS